jgi:predicted nucleic acid-binding protein
MCDEKTAIEAASYYRFLRKKSITVRKTIDVIIATRCILNNLPLLYSDRDFDPFVKHLGLQSAMP